MIDDTRAFVCTVKQNSQRKMVGCLQNIFAMKFGRAKKFCTRQATSNVCAESEKQYTWGKYSTGSMNRKSVSGAGGGGGEGERNMQ